LLVGFLLLAMPAAVSAVAGLVLGEENTTGGRTGLTAASGSATLRLANTHSGGSALSLAVEAGNPPLKVNSTSKVQKLNADKVDGLSAHQLLRIAHDSTTDVGSNVEGTMLTVSVKAPFDGYLLITGGVNSDGALGDGAYVWCNFELDGLKIPESERLISNKIITANGDIETFYSYCESSVTVPITAGTHTVNLHWEATSASPNPEEATLSALYVPFDGLGKRP
jgi:hypothetical protein